MNRIIYFLFLFSFLYPEDFICNESSEKFYCKEEFQSMSIKEKISQMIMVRVNGQFYNNEHWQKKNVMRLIKNKHIGGLITYTGSTHGTFYNLKEFQQSSKIPLFVAADYERGIGQFIDGTLFPSNMAIAATDNPNNAYKQGEITAIEAKALGVNMIFAPVLDINNNPDNPIINFRSYGDEAGIVSKFSLPYIKGIQSQNIIACGKHFPGHGDTDTDSHTSLPIINKKIKDLFSQELLPFKNACSEGIGSIMVAHILFPELDNDNPATFSQKITDNILRKQWNYNGLIITDALEMGALSSYTWHGESAIKAVEAGADIILLPIDNDEAINSIFKAVETGRISVSRIENSFNRIINAKQKLGLFNKNDNDWDDVEKKVKIYQHTKIAKNIANESITLVKNNKNIIPVDINKYNKVTHIMLSMDEGMKSRFKSYSSNISKTHGNVEEIIINDKLSRLAIKDIMQKIKSSNSDMIIISMLIRIKMDKGISTIDETHSQLIKKIKKLNIPILGVSFGSPYLSDYEILDSYLCTYGYGSVSLNAASDAIFGRIDINGKLPITLNQKYKSGHGISINKLTDAFKKRLNINFESFGLIKEAINDSIFPGAQVFISKGDKVLANIGFGTLGYDVNSEKVNKNTIYDVASLTKVLSTTPIIMKFIEKKRLDIDYLISDFYEEYNTPNKRQITIRNLLTHTSGLKSYIEYYKYSDFDRNKVINDIVTQPLEYSKESKTVYSDLGFILLMDIIEKTTNSKLDHLSDKYLYKPLGMKNTFFNPPLELNNNIAPTENDKYFRNKLLKGVVHDENAYLLDGISGHAGLFSTAEDIGLYSKMLIDGGYYLGQRYFSQKIIKEFTQKQDITVGSDFALGWDTPSQNGKSSAGDYLSHSSFGHLGFTGTSMWLDPENKIIVILLTNRVYPTRNKKNIGKKMYHFRRNFHMKLIKEILET
tara:strand:+ start:8958 stop:11783 length:2826 start_codon:yes stop_codon:yes gene_type:complete